MFAPSLDHLVNNMCFYFAKTEIRLEKGCPLRFSLNFTVLWWINYPP